MGPTNLCTRVGTGIATFSAIGGFFLVASPGGGAYLLTAILCFGAGLILVGAGTVFELSTLGVFPQQGIRFMTFGFFAFCAGFVQNVLGLAHVLDVIDKTPLVRHRLGEAIVVESCICIAVGMILMAIGCACHPINTDIRVGGVVLGVGALGSVIAMSYEFLSDSGDPFSLLAYLLLSATCCGVGLVIVLVGLRKALRARRALMADARPGS
jgi:hypothetical protein